ncbi:unnamed protein product, partial [Ectocarpus sp. 12 AP-2014]
VLRYGAPAGCRAGSEQSVPKPHVTPHPPGRCTRVWSNSRGCFSLRCYVYLRSRGGEVRSRTWRTFAISTHEMFKTFSTTSRHQDGSLRTGARGGGREGVATSPPGASRRCSAARDLLSAIWSSACMAPQPRVNHCRVTDRISTPASARPWLYIVLVTGRE